MHLHPRRQLLHPLLTALRDHNTAAIVSGVAYCHHVGWQHDAVTYAVMNKILETRSKLQEVTPAYII